MRRFLLALPVLGLLLGADKPQTPVTNSNDRVSLEATVLTTKEEIAAAVGSDLDGFVVVVEVEVRPEGNKPLPLSPDDFTLRTDKDGQRSGPYAPSQIAGRSTLVVSSKSVGRGVMSENQQGPIWGGLGGGRPQRVGGNGGGIGSPTSSEVATKVEQGPKAGASDKPSELLDVLKAKMLPTGTITEPVRGLLYFPMEGKQKRKDLELTYKGESGTLSLRFR